MAKRPTVPEILAAVRAAGPARPDADAPADSPPTSPDPASVAPPASAPSPPDPSGAEPTSADAPKRPLTIQEKLAAARNRPAAPGVAAPPPNAPTPEAPAGRPLTIQEKLAAARDRPATPSQAPSGSHAPPDHVPTPRGDRPMTIPEKLAAARDRPASAPSADPGASEPRSDEPRPADAPAPSPASTAEGPSPGRPMTLQEKLAAARGRPAAGGPPPPKPEVPATSPATAATPGSDAGRRAGHPRVPLDRLSDPHELADALRQLASAPIAVAPEAAPLIRKEAAATPIPEPLADDPAHGPRAAPIVGGPTRLRIAGIAALVLLVLIGAALVLRSAFSKGSARAGAVIVAGRPADLAPEQVSGAYVASGGFWLVRSSGYDGVDTIVALRDGDGHRECRLSWSAEDRTFRCPRDGSVYSIAGLPVGGPARRALERCAIARSDDGRILVDPDRTFREELGQWTDPESFLTP